MLLMPLLMTVPILAIPDTEMPASARGAILAFAPAFMAWMAASLTSADICYDGSALGTQIVIGTSGRDDRFGRALSFLVVFGPLQVALVLGFVAWSSRWDLLPGTVGMAAALMLSGVGVGSWASSIWQYAQPPPGGNMAARGASGGVTGLISAMFGLFVPLLLAAPTMAAAIAGAALDRWWLQLVALVVGAATGLGVLAWGVHSGGRRLDAKWPEVLERVTWKG